MSWDGSDVDTSFAGTRPAIERGPETAAPGDFTRVISKLTALVAVMPYADRLELVIQAVLTASSEFLGLRHPVLLLLESQGGRLRGRSIASPQTRQVLRRAGLTVLVVNPLDYSLDAPHTPVVQIFTESRPWVIMSLDDLERHEHLQEATRSTDSPADIDSVALVRLHVSDRSLGILAVATSFRSPFTPLDLLILQTLAAQCSLIVENARLLRQLDDREAQVSRLLKATIDAQEDERERICLEIHDGVAQTLAPAFHYLQSIDIRGLDEVGRVNLRRAGTLVRDASREAREVIASLRPSSLDTLGLAATLRQELSELGTRTTLQIVYDAHLDRFEKSVETSLYRILHEAINNVVKHARANNLAVRLRQIRGWLIAEVQDDGIGFVTSQDDLPLQRRGVGLLSMRKRAELLGGSSELISAPGQGTRVRVEVPVGAMPARATGEMPTDS